MKNIKKLLTLLLSAMMCFSVTACGNGGGNISEDLGDRRLLSFEFLQAGYGIEGYKAMAEAFMKENPDVLVKLVPNYEINSTTSTKLESNNNVSDLYLVTNEHDIRRWAIKGWVEEINDIYAAEVQEGVKLEDAMSDSAKEVGTYNGKYYSVAEYVSVNGFVYNKTLFKRYGWTIPETTAELEALCKKIRSDTNGKIAPFVYCGAEAGGYLQFAAENWLIQYEGMDNLNKFYKFDDPELFSPDNSYGKKYALENLKKFFYDNEAQYCMNKCMGKTADTAQTEFLLGKAAMMMNGSWFETEMKEVLKEANDSGANIELGMFKIPEMTDAAGNVMHAEGYVAQKDENGKDMEYAHGYIGAHYFIPTGAKNKDDAKEFLKFINRTDICELYTKYTNAVRPIDYNKDPSSTAYSGLSSFCKDILTIANTNYMYSPHTQSPLALTGVISLWAKGENWYYKMEENPVTYTPDYCIQQDYKWVKDNWDKWLKDMN